MTNIPHWIQRAGSEHRRKHTIRNIKRLARLVVILLAVWLVHTFCVAVHFTDGLTFVLCGLTAAGVYADLTA